MTDQGPGVPPEHLRYLFDTFYRVEGAVSQRPRPQGLALSKGLIAAHGGRITACNMPGGGLQVAFTLPVPASPTASGALAGPPGLARQDIKAMRETRVLLIDDAWAIVRAERPALQRHGAAVTTAATEAEGLAQAERFGPDMILLDLGLPDMDRQRNCAGAPPPR